MLSSIHIENVAVIENADVTFDNGFMILTGQTGAGKSIIIDSIELLLGERASRDLIRTGCNNAYVGAVFTDINDSAVNTLISHSITPESDGNLLIQREIFSDGRSIAKINGRHVPVTVLKELGKYLINIHGQHDNQMLLSVDSHIKYLDSFADNSVIRNEYTTLYEDIMSLRNKIKAVSLDKKEKNIRIDMLKFEIDELTKANIKEGRYEKLCSLKSAAENHDKIFSACESAYASIYKEDNNLITAVNDIASQLTGVGQLSDTLGEVGKRLENIKYELSDISSELAAFISNDETEGMNLDEIEQEIDTIYRLMKKYNCQSDRELLDLIDEKNTELSSFEMSDEYLKKLMEELESKKSQLKGIALRLTQSRIDAGESLSKKITSELAFLDMEKTVFDVCIKPSLNTKGTDLFLSSGLDLIEFMISTNVGEDLKPLAKIASGGELSRIMLAMKNVLSTKEQVDTLIFDEIDAGVSGKTAEKIGIKLKSVSKDSQVICITHLAQIASKADNQYLISKEGRDGRTYTSVKKLTYDERVIEIARILSGINITESAIDTAKSMLSLD